MHKTRKTERDIYFQFFFFKVEFSGAGTNVTGGCSPLIPRNEFAKFNSFKNEDAKCFFIRKTNAK